MRKYRRIGAMAGALCFCLALAPAAAAEPPADKPQDSPGALARESLESMLRALRLLVESIPQYELPELLENGDIIIRRKRSNDAPTEPEFDETAT